MAGGGNVNNQLAMSAAGIGGGVSGHQMAAGSGEMA